MPKTIVLDWDPRFMFHLYKCLQAMMGTKLRFSSAYHLQADGQLERTIQALEDIMRAYVLDFKGSWENCIPLI